MNGTLLVATITITLALIFYSIGVWSERRAKTLKKWHVIVFWLGLACDSTGTFLMKQIANSNQSDFYTSLHGITGALAILLMIFHALWASFVMIKGSDVQKEKFHTLSIVVWAIWLIPYFAGMFIGMMH